MSADETPAERDASQELQFDRVETSAPLDGGAATPRVTCAVCGRDVGDQYYHANGKPICESCRHVVLAATVTPRSPGRLVVAALFGLGAAVAGAAIYYAVIAIANLEIGIVAILIGYMVGWAVRKGAGGRGGRRFQIVAVALTYWAVGLAYAPLAYKGMKADKGESSTSAAATDSIRAKAPAGIERTNPDGSQPDRTSVSGREAVVALGGVFVLIFALPVISVFGSMPFGLISGLIIFIGMRQAWVMTAAPRLDLSGPYRVGTAPAAT
jgi:hypothetical protein